MTVYTWTTSLALYFMVRAGDGTHLRVPDSNSTFLPLARVQAARSPHSSCSHTFCSRADHSRVERTPGTPFGAGGCLLSYTISWEASLHLFYKFLPNLTQAILDQTRHPHKSLCRCRTENARLHETACCVFLPGKEQHDLLQPLSLYVAT